MAAAGIMVPSAVLEATAPHQVEEMMRARGLAPQRTSGVANVPLMPIDDLQMVGVNPIMRVSTDEAIPVIAVLVGEGPDKPHAVKTTAGGALQVLQSDSIAYGSVTEIRTALPSGGKAYLQALPASTTALVGVDFSAVCVSTSAQRGNVQFGIHDNLAVTDLILASEMLVTSFDSVHNIGQCHFSQWFSPPWQIPQLQTDAGYWFLMILNNAGDNIDFTATFWWL